MNQVIMTVMAIGAVLGGIDRIFGNRLGLGACFEEGFRMLGTIALSMAGIICLSPVLAGILSSTAAPIFRLLGIDPGMLGSVLAIDMGGYQLCTELADSALVGRFAGIVVSAIFGCTIVFTIPVGMGIVPKQDRPLFAQGILLGLCVMPAALLAGGLICGMSIVLLLWQCVPIFAVSALLLVGILRYQTRSLAVFSRFAKVIEAVTTLGLILGAVQYMTGWQLLPGLLPIADGMQIACGIAIVMLGSLPLAEILRRILRSPFAWIGSKTGLNDASTTGLLVGMISVVPALVMMKDMDRRGKIVNAAFLVCSASVFAAHLGFTVSVAPDMTAALLVSKLSGGVLGILAAMLATEGYKKTVS